jgi:beta-galactosidase
MTYGGIYRDVYLDIKNPVYIQDVFVKTSSNHLESEITLEGGDVPEGYTVEQKVVSAASSGGEPSACITTAAAKKILTACDASPVVAWTLENPALYNLVTVLKNEKGKAVDTKTVRFVSGIYVLMKLDFTSTIRRLSSADLTAIRAIRM